MEISKDDFLRWKNNEITVKIFEFLEQYKKEVEEQLLNSEIILAKDSNIKCAILVGQRDVINDILQIQYEEVT